MRPPNADALICRHPFSFLKQRGKYSIAVERSVYRILYFFRRPKKGEKIERRKKVRLAEDASTFRCISCLCAPPFFRYSRILSRKRRITAEKTLRHFVILSQSFFRIITTTASLSPQFLRIFSAKSVLHSVTVPRKSPSRPPSYWIYRLRF